MRIIRTVDGGPEVPKGWVREGILSALSKEPATLTEVAQGLRISKSTASYHLSLLSKRGVIEPVSTRMGRGGVKVVRYGLRSGTFVLFGGAREEENELRRMRETFDLETLGWKDRSQLGVSQVQTLLYKLFLLMFRITRSEHRRLMLDYGERTGSLLAGRVHATSARQASLAVATFLRETGMSDADLVEFPGSAVSALISSVCIGSEYHIGNSCYFLEGMVGGMVRGKIGAGVAVERVEVPGISGCCIATGRVKSIDQAWLGEALVSSPRYSSINRGERRH